ncbi:hypothetical protein, partial [Bradyrhizobium elkanii]|uniref:hypothetical protein n=1 Tax=Bradyrhizobium elkanii TaxID=29448 RepID=UPI001AEBC8B4
EGSRSVVARHCPSFVVKPSPARELPQQTRLQISHSFQVGGPIAELHMAVEGECHPADGAVG